MWWVILFFISSACLYWAARTAIFLGKMNLARIFLLAAGLWGAYCALRLPRDNALVNLLSASASVFFLGQYFQYYYQKGKGKNRLVTLFNTRPYHTILFLFGKSPSGMFANLGRYVPRLFWGIDPAFSASLYPNILQKIENLIDTSGDLQHVLRAIWEFNAPPEDTAAFNLLASQITITMRQKVVPRALLVTAGVGAILIIVSVVATVVSVAATGLAGMVF